MNKATLFGSGVLVMALVVGCGSGSAEDKVMKQQVDLINEMSSVLEGVKDEASAKAAQAKYAELKAKEVDLEKQTTNWSKEKKEEMLKKHKDELAKAATRFIQAGLAAEAKGFKAK